MPSFAAYWALRAGLQVEGCLCSQVRELPQPVWGLRPLAWPTACSTRLARGLTAQPDVAAGLVDQIVTFVRGQARCSPLTSLPCSACVRPAELDSGAGWQLTKQAGARDRLAHRQPRSQTTAVEVGAC